MGARIAVVGSRLTHHAVVAGPGLEVPSALFMARVSLAGLGTPPAPEVDLAAIGSDFNRALVRRDVERTLVADLAAGDPDLIVVDLLEERGDLLVLDSGAVLAASPELAQTGLLEQGHRLVRRGDEHRALWTAGWERFVAALRSAGLWDRVVLHRAGLLTRDVEGVESADVPFLERVNAYLDTLYDRAAQDVPAGRVLALPAGARAAAASAGGPVDPLRLGVRGDAEVAVGLLRALDEVAAAATEPAAEAGPESTPAAGEDADTDTDVAAAPAARPAFLPGVYPEDRVDVLRWESRESFAAGPLVPGVHVLPLADGNHLDLVVGGDLTQVPEGHSVVVFLGGALARRDGVAPPFLTGGRLAHSLGIPWVAVSDPTLQLSEEILQGWYTGGPDSAAQTALADALRSVGERAGRDLLLVGGAGGGFAALRLADELGEAASVLAWNPHTELVDVEPGSLRAYLETVFPGAAPDPEADREAVARRLEEAGIAPRVESLLSARRVLVLQTVGDPQAGRQLMPLLARSDGMGPGPLVFATDPDHVVRIADWGAGAAVLPSDATAAAIAALGSGERPEDVLARITPLLDRGDSQERGVVSVPPEQGGEERPIEAEAVEDAVDEVPAERSEAVEEASEVEVPGPTAPGSEEACAAVQEGDAQGAVAPMVVQDEEDGRVRLDWSRALEGLGDDVVVSLGRRRGDGATGRIEDVRPPLLIRPLGEGERWRLEVVDAAGRRVRTLDLDARGREVEDEASRGGRGGLFRRRGGRR